jgi:hypothetical protein
MAANEPKLIDQIETKLTQLAASLPEEPASGRGRPLVLPAAVLWSAIVLGVLKGRLSQLGIWRIIADATWWHQGTLQLSASAVAKRLISADAAPMAAYFQAVTDLLKAEQTRPPLAYLADFATAVVALDETTLDPVVRKLPILRGIRSGDPRLLPGKLTVRFDLRRQLFDAVTIQPNAQQNEKVAAPEAVADLPPGALILADLGYFKFAWFDDLTAAGHHWVSRLRKRTSSEVHHTFYKDLYTFDGVVWLGAHRSDKAKHLVRLVRFFHQGQPYAYLTNVLEPERLSIAEIVELYERRWDIERAFDLLKTDLHLHLLWSGKFRLIEQQVWGALVIAQVLLALRTEIALVAEADVGEVSIKLLIQYFPDYAKRYDDPVRAYAENGRRLRLIRPVKRKHIIAPGIPLSAMTPAPPDLVTTRTPRYAGKQ